MNIAFPLRVAADGRIATARDPDHIREMIELLLFTQPGERVMRPDLGTGLLRFVHAANSPELAAALRLTVQAALSQFLGDVVDVRDLHVEAIDSELRVTLAYALRTTGEARVETFVRGTT